jgi:TRAP-type C4-dicarboxylate transport system permease large subunit
MMIVYSIITETPLLGLFAGALVPGLMALAFYVAAILLVTARRPDIAPRAARLGWGARLRGLRDAGAVIAIFLLVIGGIYGRLFTPTEAASVGAFLTGAVFLATQGLDLAGLRQALLETAGTTAMTSSS